MDVNRSYQRISKADLRRLARIGNQQREDFFTRHPEFALLYRKRLLCTALAGDAAAHYVNGTTGLIEFNVWWFFAEHPEAQFPFHMIDHADLGRSKVRPCIGCATRLRWPARHDSRPLHRCSPQRRSAAGVTAVRTRERITDRTRARRNSHHPDRSRAVGRHASMARAAAARARSLDGGPVTPL
jgi:hypothetical protein